MTYQIRLERPFLPIMTTPFPQELIDQIVDYNHDDPNTLKTCSTISHSWRSPSQHHLFHTVIITNATTLSRFTRLVNRSPHLARLVREICFNTYANYRNPDLKLWIDRFFTIPIDKLVRLRSLRFEKVEWDRVYDKAKFEAILVGFKRLAKLTELHFSGCSFSTFFQFEEIVSAVPSVSKLSIDLISWKMRESKHCIDSQMEKPPKLPLSSVEFHRYSDPAGFSEWLLRMPVPASLESVAFDWVFASDAKHVGRLLESLGPALKHVRVGCKFDQNPVIANSLNEYIDLSLNTGLCSIHLVVSDLQDYLTPWVPALLFQVAQAPLVRITFEMWLHDYRQLESTVWNEVEGFLSRDAFKSVQEVVFIHRGDLDMKSTISTLEWRFPDLLSRHVLQVQNRSPFLLGNLR